MSLTGSDTRLKIKSLFRITSDAVRARPNRKLDQGRQDVAIYVVTDDDSTDWDEKHRYRYRHTGTDGSAGAQDEVDLRLAAGLPVALWRWEKGKATLMEVHAARPQRAT
jgi:hypothetical protein